MSENEKKLLALVVALAKRHFCLQQQVNVLMDHICDPHSDEWEALDAAVRFRLNEELTNGRDDRFVLDLAEQLFGATPELLHELEDML